MLILSVFAFAKNVCLCNKLGYLSKNQTEPTSQNNVLKICQCKFQRFCQRYFMFTFENKQNKENENRGEKRNQIPENDGTNVLSILK